MKKIKVMTVFGTRPEAIKMAPVVKELEKSSFLNVKVCVTAQHREMLDQVLELFEIEPHYDLNIMKPGQDLFDVTANIMIGIKRVLDDFKPDIILVHGDTTTSFSVALAAFYRGIPIGHVEAGLRTYDLKAPWPEEANRQLTARLTTYHFAPTETAKQNILNEHVHSGHIIITGNTVIDSLFWVTEKIKADGEEKYIREKLNQLGYNHQKKRRLLLVTGHRRENFGEGFLRICNSLKTIALQEKNLDIVYPVHLNPSVRKPVYEILKNIENIYLIEPLDYKPFVYLMNKSTILLTDSGGIQEEAPSLGKPVLVMRNTTERPEAIEAGTVKLVGTNSETIVDSVTELLNNEKVYKNMAHAHNPYGDGKASIRIREHIESL